jgi:hypothetical protein
MERGSNLFQVVCEVATGTDCVELLLKVLVSFNFHCLSVILQKDSDNHCN